MTAWVVVVATACTACSSPSSENPRAAGEVMETVPVVQAAPQPRMPKKVPLQIDRQLPDARWEPAADAALKILQPWLDDRPSFTRLVVKPLTAPDGTSIDYLFAYEAFSAKESKFRGSMLIADGKLVGEGGQTDATRYLHAIGFPAKQVDRGLLLEVLRLSRVATAGWASSPSVFGWSMVFDDDGGRLGRDRGVVTYDKGGATFTLYRPRPSQLLEERHLADRLVLQFDSTAVITISSAREQQDKTWKPIPVGP